MHLSALSFHANNLTSQSASFAAQTDNVFRCLADSVILFLCLSLLSPSPAGWLCLLLSTVFLPDVSLSIHRFLSLWVRIGWQRLRKTRHSLREQADQLEPLYFCAALHFT